MSIKQYIDTRFNLSKVTSIASYPAERTNKTDIYLIDDAEGVRYKINATTTVTTTSNQQGKGTIIAINNTEAIYLEHLSYYPSLAKLLDNLKSFMETVITKPIGTAPAGGPVVTEAELIQKATAINTQIEVLKKELP